MNSNDMTNEQLRERIQLLERLRELENGTVRVMKQPSLDPSKWYPDDRNWIEYSPDNPVDRSKVVDFMRQYERETRRFQPAQSIYNYTIKGWDAEFNWRCHDGDKIVAVVLKD